MMSRRFFSTLGIPLRSSGLIFDQYTYVEKQPFGYDYLKAKAQEAKSVLKSSYSSAFIQRHIPEFSYRSIPSIAEDLFSKFIDAHRRGDVNALRSILSEGIFDGIREEIHKQKRQQEISKPNKSSKGTKTLTRVFRSAFVIDGFVSSSQVLQMRHGFSLVGSSRSKDNGFAQV